MLHPAEYENIIFDYGGVIINIDTERSVQEFANLARKDPMQVFQEFMKSSVFPEYEKGAISSEEFFSGVRELIGEVDDRAIEDAWNAMIGEIPPSRIHLLQKLGERKNIFLLSNTNEIHLNRVALEVQKVMEQDLIDPLFRRAYYSHLIGMRKPDLNIYESVIEENELDPSKTVFLDDNKDNLKGAEKAGLGTFLITSETDIVDLFEEVIR